MKATDFVTISLLHTGQKSVILALQSSQRQTWPHGNKIIPRRFWQQTTHACTSGCSFSRTFCCLSIWEEVCCFWVCFFNLRMRSFHHFRVISPTMTRPMPPHINARNLHRGFKKHQYTHYANMKTQTCKA